MKFVPFFVLFLAGQCALARADTVPAHAPLKRGAAQAVARPLDARAVLKGVNAWFNRATTLECDFVQLGPNGRRSSGKLYIDRPGKLRFEYDPPSTLEIIADGRSVAVRDRRLATQDQYFLSQTPLKFLLKEPFDIARDLKVLDLQINPDNIAVRVEDSTTFGGTSRIRLIFDPKTFQLEQWAVVDPQGYETLVSLSNVNTGVQLDPQLFRIPERERD